LGKNCSGWYIDEAYVKEFLMYFDELMAWRKCREDEDYEPIDAETSIVIRMLKSSTLKLTMYKEVDELSCVFEAVKENQATMSEFDLPPPTSTCTRGGGGGDF
jgi:hypothetical protein